MMRNGEHKQQTLVGEDISEKQACTRDLLISSAGREGGSSRRASAPRAKAGCRRP